MSRLLTLLLLYKSGYSAGKYISIERQIEKKDRYYDVLEMSDIGWREEEVGKFTGAEVVSHCSVCLM